MIRIHLYASTGSSTVIAEQSPAGAFLAHPYFFTPDGARLVFRQAGDPETGHNIGMIAVDGGSEPEWLLRSEFNENNAALSPDGRWMAYQSDRSGRYTMSGHSRTLRKTDGRFQTPGESIRSGPEMGKSCFIWNRRPMPD